MSRSTRMDHRAEILASMIRHRVQVIAEAIRPEGASVPFTEQRTNEEALAFWRKHRFSPIGKDILAGWQPPQVMQLDSWLARNPDPSVGAQPPGGPL